MKSRYNNYRFAFVFGSLIIILLFTLAPLVYSIWLSLQSGRANNLSFSGLNNYLRLFDDAVIAKALTNTIGFCLFLTPAVLLVSILLANCINEVRSEKLKGLYSVILFFPGITSPVAYAFFFRKLFAADGFLNRFNLIFNPNAEMVNYLLTPYGARIAIIIVCMWAWSGYYTMLLLSAMQSIDPSVYKAARIDGLNTRQMIYKITLPIIKPVVLLCSVLLSGGIFQLFAEVMIISKGGPEHSTITLSYYIYQLCFEYVPQFGYAASIAILIFIVSGTIGFIQLKAGEKNI
ncbi:MAG: sugar ABC transporter permease [Crenarchaeota archaeon]|nr:sugar ABC transporter permease [Thermoproteota archaeon]